MSQNPIENKLAQEIFEAIPESRLVGGCVRDYLANLPCKDHDMCAPFPPEEVKEILEKSGKDFKLIDTGLKHGTWTVFKDGETIEITSLREDVETDGRHAKVRYHSSFELDAERRDLTINSLSMDRTGKIHDYTGGADDLKNGRVVFVGDPNKRIEEDALRALRWFRFQARFGKDQIDKKTEDALIKSRFPLLKISVERICMETTSLLKLQRGFEMLKMQEKMGLLKITMPSIKTVDFDKMRVHENPLVNMAQMMDNSLQAKNQATYFKMSIDDSQFLQNITKNIQDFSPENCRRIYALHPKKECEAIIFRHKTHGIGTRNLERAIKSDRPVFVILGRDLLERGVKPGPEMGVILKGLKDTWTKEACPVIDKKWIDKNLNIKKQEKDIER